MQEIFMDIKGYEGSYQVSNLGNIRNSRGKILTQRKSNCGYMKVDLWKNGKGKTYLVHRLVLATFKPNSNNELQVNHINELKSDNRLENLEWMTPKQNCNYGTRNDRMANAKKVKVTCIELNKTFDSAEDAIIFLGRKNGRRNISACCNGKQKSAYGYHWKHAE